MFRIFFCLKSYAERTPNRGAIQGRSARFLKKLHTKWRFPPPQTLKSIIKINKASRQPLLSIMQIVQPKQAIVSPAQYQDPIRLSSLLIRPPHQVEPLVLPSSIVLSCKFFGSESLRYQACAFSELRSQQTQWAKHGRGLLVWQSICAG